ncbi:hypothetical protein EN829_039495, partial [Mesorhizobium sp. M00.F.Ca.ET.186.01.1.1]
MVKIKTCGVCHTDLHAAHGDWPVKPKLPLIPGHEGVGVVEKLGEGVTSLKLGDRVGIPWLFSACGECLNQGLDDREGFAAFLLRLRGRGTVPKALIAAFEATPRRG